VSTFKPAGLNSDLFSPDARAAVAAAIEPATSLHPVTFAAFREVPWNLFGTLASGRSQLIFRTPYLDNELVALAYRAPRAARTSPRSALRFLERVNPELARIPTDRGHSGTKRDLPWLVRRAVAEFTFKLDYLHKEGLPRTLAPFDPLLDALAPFNLLNRHKFLPYARWFRNELEPYIASVLADKPTRELSFLNARFLGRILADHVRGRRNYVREINAVLTLEAVDRLLLHAPHPTPGAASFPENPPGMTRP
jgi:asparagine synthase (glutamine-hydrolysing)